MSVRNERFVHRDVVRLRERRYARYDYTKAKGAYQTFMAELEERS